MLQRLAELLQKKAVVLMYHRIAEPDTDPWQLSVSPSNFEAQLKVLRATRKVIPVQALAEQLAKKKIAAGSICITFDDAYTDNYIHAKPLLEKYQCAATLFPATRFLDRPQPFWWDELEAILLRAPSLPEHFEQVFFGSAVNVHLEEDSSLTPAAWQQHRQWVWTEPPPTRRCALYLTLWEHLRPLPFNEIEAAMQGIRSWAGTAPAAPVPDCPMTSDQIREFISNPLFDLGLHTHTHADLGAHPAAVQEAEISGSAAFLQTHFMHRARTIAFPYGRYNSNTLSLVRALSLTAAFTTSGKFVTRLTDPHQIPRFQVCNWNSESFAWHLRRWRRGVL